MAEPHEEGRRPSVASAAPPDPEPGAPSPGGAGAEHAPATCPVAWCPICLAVTAVQPVRPEVVEHLLQAGTEFFLALRSLIDARADDLGRSDARDGGDDDGDLHRIDIG